MISEHQKAKAKLWKINNKERYAAWSKEYAKKYRAEHKEQFENYEKEYYAKNREKILAKNKAWYKNNGDWARLKTSKRRAIYKGGTCTVHEWQEIQRKYEFKCLCCGKTRELTMDHIVPIKLGGKHEAENIQPLCFPCNLKKRTRVIDFRKV